MVSVTGAQRLSHQRRTPRPRTSTRARQLERSTGCTLQAELDAFETQCDAVLSCLAVSYAASTLQGATLTLATGARMKHALYFALDGAILVATLTAWLAPGVITWYFNPPVEMGALVAR